MTYFELFFTFAKIGVCTFGGGYAMLPFLQKECVEKKKWVSDDDLLNYFAIGQCTPGIIAVNTATFIGAKNKGVLGGIIATFGVVFPSFIIISCLASILYLFKDNSLLLKAFAGIRISVCALILNSLYKMIKKNSWNLFTICLSILTLLLQIFININSIYIIFCSLIFGLVYYLFNKEKI